MILDRVFEVKLSSWEERVAAALFLSGSAFRAEAFGETVGLRINEMLERLREMPETWSKEFSIEVLKRED